MAVKAVNTIILEIQNSKYFFNVLQVFQINFEFNAIISCIK
jgi:hypothetical protein